MMPMPRTCHGQVKLRNPWAETEWNGDWADGSSMWVEHAEAAAAAGYTAGGSKDDGTFFMSFADFERIFDIIDILPKAMQ